VEKPYRTVNILLPATARTSPARSEALGAGQVRGLPRLPPRCCHDRGRRCYSVPDSVKEECRYKETNTYDLRSWKRGEGDYLNNGLPTDPTYMRGEYFDNGRRRGKARHTAKLSFTNKPGAEIDTRALTARYVDFTDPVRFKRTMANHCPDDTEWYEAHRQFAYELRDGDKTIREVLIGMCNGGGMTARRACDHTSTDTGGR
jgi:hypothetical protein